MARTNITSKEKQQLQAYVKTSPIVLIRLKSQAILFASHGVRTIIIANSLGRSERTVSDWLSAWRSSRFASIFSGHQDNTNAAKLTREQQEQIKSVLAQPPHEQGIPKEFWDVPTLKDYILAKFSVVYESSESYYFLLRFAGLSFKYPDTFDRKRNEQLIAKHMEAIRSEIKPLLRRNNWEVFAADEVKMQQDAIIRRCWLKKGERTIIKVNRDKQSQSYIGFLNQKSFKCHLYDIPWQNSNEVLKALEQFLNEYPDKRICVIWDNAAFHKSKQIKDQLKQHGILERVHLIAMPPYAPDNNPIEHVWNTAKQAVANIQRDSFKKTKQAFSDFVASRLFRYSF